MPTADNALVTQRFNQGMSIANGAVTSTIEFINAMRAFIDTQEPLTAIVPIPTPDYEQLPTPNLTRPVSPVIEFPDLPITDLVPPDSSFDWQDVPYTSELANALEAELLDRIAEGGTGLTREVEDGIVNREQERAELELQFALRGMADMAAESSYSLPDGSLSAGAAEIYAKYQDARLTSSREVMVKSFDLAQKNTELTITSGVAFEGQKKQFSAEEKKLILEAAKTKPEVAALIFKAQVEYANVYLARYNALASKANALSEILKAETQQYLADSEVQKNVVESSVKKFTAEVAAVATENETNIKNADLILRQFIEFITFRLDAAKSAAAVYAQVAASALTGMSASASLGASVSSTESVSDSTSTSTNLSYDMTKSTPEG